MFETFEWVFTEAEYAFIELVCVFNASTDEENCGNLTNVEDNETVRLDCCALGSSRAVC